MSPSPIVRMANQIARAFAVHGEEAAIAHTAQHIAQFWDPRMRRQLDQVLAEGEAGLSPVAAAAASRLAAATAPA